MKTPSIGLDQNQEGRFIDKYWGRVPKFLHWIPQANICDVNPEYINLINGVIDGNIFARNLSIELYNEIICFIDMMPNSCSMNQMDAALYRAYNGNEACPNNLHLLDCNGFVCCGGYVDCKKEGC